MTPSPTAAVREAYEREPGRLYGFIEPRLATPPLRPLTPDTTLGYDVIEFAERIGEPLLPWQCEVVKRGLELLPNGDLRFRVVLVLVARQNGKSHLSRILCLWRLYARGAKLVVGSAQDLDTAKEHWEMAVELAQECEALAPGVEFVRRTNGQNEFKVTREFGGGRYKIVTSSANVKGKAGRGKSTDHVTLDELRTHETWKAWSSLRKTISARDEGQVWALSNAGDDSSVVLNALRDGAVALIEGADPEVDEVDDTVCLLEYSGEDECELDDWTQLRHANPAMGWIKPLERDIRSDLNTAGIPPEVIRSEVLCQRVGQLEGAVNLAAWKGSLDAAGTLAHQRDRLALAVDVALDGAHVSAVLAAEVGADRVRVESAGAWNDTATAVTHMRDIVSRTMPRVLIWAKNGPSAAIAVELRQLADEFDIPAIEVTGGDLTEACQAFANMVQIGAVLHKADALFDAQVQGAKKKRQGDGFVFTRSGKSHVDAVYAMALATRGARTLPEEVDDVEPLVLAAW